MKDTKTVLDAVRSKIPGHAKLLVAYMDPAGGPVMLSQANMSQQDILDFANGLIANATSQKFMKHGA